MDVAPELVLALLAHLPEGVLLLDLSHGGSTVYFADGAPPRPLAELMGWSGNELEGLRQRLAGGEAVVLSIPRNEATVPLQLLPLPRAANSPSYFIGLERGPGFGTTPGQSTTLPVLLREDRLTGLSHRDWFFELFRRDFHIAAREQRSLSLFLIDIDALGVYNETFGRGAGDGLIRLVGRAVQAGMRRASDVVARDAGGRYLALAIGQTADQARRHADQLAARVRELHLHHPRSPVARLVTVSIGVAHWDAQLRASEMGSAEALYSAGLSALAQCRRAGRNRVSLSEPGVLA